MRALLVVNPASTTASPRTREVLLAAIEGEAKLDVVETRHRAHATELACQARADGLELVVVLGGDGTVNEVVNGLLAEGPHPDVPHLAVVPGGGTNVFARALGIPRDPVEATGALLRSLRGRQRRSIGLGRVDDRWFTFNAGLGWDAEVVEAVDRRRTAHDGPRLRNTAGDYLRAAASRYFLHTDRRHPPLTVTFEDDRPDAAEPAEETGLHLVMVANTAPWTYLGGRPIGPFPDASFESGLDLYALRSLRTFSTLRQVSQVLSRGGAPARGRAVVSRHDVGAFRVSAGRPVALQVDGEPLGERVSARFSAVADALQVVCPPL